MGISEGLVRFYAFVGVGNDLNGLFVVGVAVLTFDGGAVGARHVLVEVVSQLEDVSVEV